MNGNKAQTIDLSFLRSRAGQRRITLVALGFGLAAALYGVVASKWYRSMLGVVPITSQKPSGIAGLLGSDVGGLAASLGPAIGGGGADSSRIAAVLQSIAVSDAVVEKFNLQERYGKKYREAAREALWKHCEVQVLPKPGLVQLTCEDKDPRFVQQMLSYFAEYGNQIFRRVNVSSASEEVRFLERRVMDLKLAADEAAARIRSFQEEHQIVDLESQARGVVSSVAALNAQRIGKQMELDYARSFSTRDEPGTRQLEAQLSVVNDQLRDLEAPAEKVPPASASGLKGDGQRTGLFPAALAVPKLRAEYEKLYRDRKVAEATLVFALDRLEGAKANEARDVSTFVVLDPPALPTRPSRPLPLPVLMALGLVVGLAAGMGLEWWRSLGRPGLASLKQSFEPRSGT